MKALLPTLGLVAALTPLACGTRAGARPPQDPSAAETAWDAGLPPTPHPAHKSIIVPSDVGLGAGPSGSTAVGATPPPGAPPAN